MPGPHRTEAAEALQAILSGTAVDEVESRTFDCKEDVSTRGAGGEALVGAALDAEWLRKRIWELTDPHLTVDVQEVQEEAGERRVRLLLIVAPRSLVLHRVGRRVKHRIAKDCVDMPPDDQRRALEDRRGFDWTAEPTAHVVEEANPAAVERARGYLRESGEESRIRLAREETADLLRKLGVADEKNRLNRAGALLFLAPESVDEVALSYKRRSAPGADSTNRLDLGRPLLELYHEVKIAIDAANDLVQLNLPSGVRPQIRTIPDLAVREAIINALMHRDYRLPDPVDVEFVGTELVVNSPGGFVSGVNESNILSHPSAPRNATLARAFRALRPAEYEGVGVDRMYREMIRAGHAPPAIDEVGGRIRCVLLGGPPVEPIVELISTLPHAAQDDVDIALIVHELLDRTTLTPGRLAPILQKTEREALAALRRAEAAEVVTPTANTARSKRPTFVLSGAAREVVREVVRARLTYLRTGAAGAKEHVVGQILETGRISPVNVREQLRVGSARADATH